MVRKWSVYANIPAYFDGVTVTVTVTVMVMVMVMVMVIVMVIWKVRATSTPSPSNQPTASQVVIYNDKNIPRNDKYTWGSLPGLHIQYKLTTIP